MRTVIRIVSLLIFVVVLSCEKQGNIVNCSDCTAIEPTISTLKVKLDVPANKSAIEINVYEGNLEDNVLYSSFFTSGTETTIPVTLHKKYTVTATYYIPNNYYTAVDSATPEVKYEKNQCNNPCYFVYDRNIDLRIKHL